MTSALSERSVVVLPLGAIEQHGPHLPLHTDTTIATGVAARAAARLDALDIAPIAIGASGEHQSFAGTVSIGTAALRLVLVELVRSVSTWAPRVVFVNGHGGNLAALELAVGQLRGEGHDAAWVPCATPGGDAHAGPSAADELGMGTVGPRAPVLYLAPELVDMSAARCIVLEHFGANRLSASGARCRSGGCRTISTTAV